MCIIDSRHDERQCMTCVASDWHGQAEPEIVDDREQVLDPYTAYQITSMLEGVVQRGTATTIREVGKPLAGKTGTTNDFKDAWFVGYSPDLAVGVFIGYDRPRPLGQGMTGGRLAAPVFRDFMQIALEDKPAVPFRVPPGIELVRIDANTGMRAGPGDERVILEAFKPGQEPPSAYSVVGLQSPYGQPMPDYYGQPMPDYYGQQPMPQYGQPMPDYQGQQRPPEGYPPRVWVHPEDQHSVGTGTGGLY
jgi:penicillin-binding protein 1A